MRVVEMDDAEIGKRLDALNINAGEETLLKRVAAIFEQEKEQVAFTFLKILQRLVPPDAYQRVREQLGQMQEEYFSRMLNGPYDAAYAKSRFVLGYIFYHAGVKPEHYIAAFSEYYGALILAVEPRFREEMGAVGAVLNKMLLLDTSLIMETYFYEDKNRFKKLHRKYGTVIDAMRDGVVILDAKTLSIIEVNRRIEEFTALSRSELIGKEVFTLHPPEFRKIIKKTLKKGVSERYGLIPELYILNHKSGEYQPVEATYAQFELDDDGYIVKIVRDIKDRLSTQKKLSRINRLYRVLSAVNGEIVRAQNSEELYQAICRIIVEEGGFKFAWIAEIEDECHINPVAYCKAAYFYENIEADLEASVNDNIEQLIERLKEEGYEAEAHMEEGIFVHEKLVIPIWCEKEFISIPLYNNREILAILKVYSNEVNSFCSDEIHLFKEIANDISYAITTMENREHLEFLTNFDLLTRLPNRHLFKERLEMAVYSANYQKEVFATVLVDIDQFKLINDTFGYGFGDMVLLKVAEHLKRIARPEDVLARYGSDEFALIFFNLKCKEEISHFVETINELSTYPVTLDREEIYLTLSTGIALFPKDAHSASDLKMAAETALKVAKAHGGNTYVFYAEEMGSTDQSKIRFQNELKKATYNGEFKLFYQPQIDLRTMQVCGAEALIRWIHPEKGLISPNEFIPILEESYLIEEIGQWVLEETCRQIKAWQAQQLELAVAINISTKQITRNNNFFTALVDTVLSSGIDPGLLHVEVTESLIMENLSVVESGLQVLGEQGIRSSIDDFGTGYSSLFYLKKLPVYALKIDRAFIKNLPHNEEDIAISNAIVSMSRSLNKKTIAEGVETDEQLKFLKEIGCDMVQGFLFSRPLPVEEFEAFCRKFR